MTVQIDPVILRKLDDFSQRRRKLILLRGLFATAATLLLAMMLVAVIDAIFVLPDAARWSLSGAAYLAVLIVEWRASLRLLVKKPDRRELARMVESTEPGLRESLLSAVELSEADQEALGTSVQFRRLLERDVSQHLSRTDMEALLPVQLVRRSIAAGLIALLLCLVAFVLSGRQFGTLLLRALAPGANLARVSQVQVRIVEPSQPNKIVAQGETEPLVIEITGKRVNAARLETVTASGRSVLKMTPAGQDRFSATIQIGREDVTYRIFAGDAITQKFQLRAVARPHIVSFAKTFTFPSYVHREPRSVTDENGDLIALEGSQVELHLTTNQPVRDGELRLEQGGQSSTVKLDSDARGLTARLALNASGTYRVHLISAETGFENKFSPEYELRAEPDLVPQVELESPKQDLILPANEIVTLSGTASDDQGLARVTQFVKVNEGPWREFPIVQDPGLTAVIEHRWDLYEQGARPGDLLSTKLLAVDLKGGRAESRTLRISVTKSGFETKRLGALETQRRLYETLLALRAAGEQLAKRSRETRDQFNRVPEGDEQRGQLVLTAGSALGEFDQAATTAWDQLLVTLKEAEAGHLSADLVQIGRAVSRAMTGFAQSSRAAVDALSTHPVGPQGRDLMGDFAENAEKAAQRTRKVEESHRAMLGAEEFEVITENLLVISGEARRLTELATTAQEPAHWISIAGRLRVVLAECRSIEELAEAAASHTPGDRLKSIRKEFAETRERIDRALTAGEPGPGLREQIQNLNRIAAAAAQHCLGNTREIAERAVREHLDLVRETQPTWAHFEKLREELSRLRTRKEWPEDLRAALAERAWETRGQLLKQHGDLEETRVAADTQFLNDTRIATRALDALRMKSTEATVEENKTNLTAFDKNFRILESGHSLAELLDGLQHLAAAERWEIATTHERVAGPREWRWLESRLRYAPEELNRIEAAPPLREVVQRAHQLLATLGALPAWNEMNREMNERFVPQREPLTAAKAVTPIALQVKQALDLLRPSMDDARKQLAELAPKLHEVMNDLAKKSEELKQKTEEQAQQAAEKKPEQAQADAEQALAQQQKLSEKIEALKDALRADANQQDILKDEGRERARDADDALALLKEPPPNAEAALTEAAEAPTAAQKSEALKTAAQEQQKLASALDQLAKHYENAEQGKAQESRTALRKTEEQTGIKEAMDQQFAKAEELQKMAEQSPEELLKKLEAALPKNPLMQQELSNISRNTLEDAVKKLTAASSTENQVAQNVEKMAKEQPAATPDAAPNPTATPPTPNTPATPATPNPTAPPQPPDAAAKPPMAQNPALAQAAEQQKPIAQAATEAGEDIARTGRHEQRLSNAPPGEKLEALGNQVKETAATQVAKAEQALAQAEQAAQAAPAVNAANEQLQKHLGDLKKAASAPQPSAAQPGEAPPSQSPNSPPEKAAPSPQGNAPKLAGATPATPPGGQPPGTPDSTPPAAAPPAPGDAPPMPQLPSAFGQTPEATASPVEQMWMARTLDSLDAALNAEPPSDSDGQAQSNEGQPGKQEQPGQQGQPSKKGQQPGQQPGQQMSAAQQAMNNAAKAAAAAMRASRSPKPNENQGDPNNDDGPEQQVSRGGAQAQAAGKAYGKLQDAKGKAGEWGKLPKQVAEQLSRGKNENVAGEYRNQVETYYKVIAEKSKKP